MKLSILIISSFIILLFLSGCGPEELPGLSGSPTSTPTQIPTSTPNLTPTITPIPITSTPSLPGTITGTVVDASGLPLVDIPIQLYKKRNQVVVETKTDGQGEYTFKDISPGKYIIRYDIVLSPTYVQHYYIPEFEVESGATTRQDIVHQN